MTNTQKPTARPARREIVATEGLYLSITGMVHTNRSCGTRGRNRAALVTAEDVAYWAERGTTHPTCTRCM